MRRGLSTIVLVIAGATIAVAGTVVPAQAAPYFVSPGSARVTAPCEESDPCRLDVALTTATLGDEILLEPGDYYDSGTIPWGPLPNLDDGVILRASDPLDPPVIHGELRDLATPFISLRPGAIMRDLEVRTTAPPGTSIAYAVAGSAGSLIDRSVIRVTGNGVSTLIACTLFSTTLRNTACLADGAGNVSGITSSLANGPHTSNVVNATAISTGTTGYGIRAGQSGMSTNTINISNSIARGPTADLSTGTFTGTPPQGTATLNVSYSNWNTYAANGNGVNQLNTGAGVQTATTGATPLFRDSAGGDYRPAPGSPTIDAGLASANVDPLAPGGATRTIGAAPDMGAFEFAPPPGISAPSATEITATAARLNAVIDPAGSPTRTSFEIEGPGMPARTLDGALVGSQAGPTPISAAATDLQPGITYTFRARAESPDGGSTTGEPVNFTTPPALADPVLRSLKIPKRWRLRKGTRIRIQTSDAARVRLRFERRRRSTFRRAGSITTAVTDGLNVRRFKGRVGRRWLKPGRYRLIGVALAADGRKSQTRVVRFRLVR